MRVGKIKFEGESVQEVHHIVRQFMMPEGITRRESRIEDNPFIKQIRPAIKMPESKKENIIKKRMNKFLEYRRRKKQEKMRDRISRVYDRQAMSEYARAKKSQERIIEKQKPKEDYNKEKKASPGFISGFLEKRKMSKQEKIKKSIAEMLETI